MLQHDHFQKNEAWIVFKLNDTPIKTVADGDFDLIALMDAASGVIVGSTLISVTAAELSTDEASHLLDEGEAYWKQRADTLLVPTDFPATHLTVEAEQRGLPVVRVPEDQLLLFISQPRAEFKERMG